MKQAANLLVILLLLMPGLSAGEESARFSNPDIALVDDASHLVLDGNLEFVLSQTALEALDNGLPITIKTRISIIDPDKWLWQKTLWSASYTQQIQYHALSHQYLVKDIQSSYPRTLLSRSSAIRALGGLRKMKLVKKTVLDSLSRYELEITTNLDINSLPTPLRPLAYLSEKWKLQETWKTLQTK